MGEADFVLTLAAGLTAALVLGYITQRMKLSPIVGYLIAGIILGPATPGFDADREIASQFAEVGIILLMFGVGLQFHFKELFAVRRVAIPGALAHTIVISGLGGAVMIWAGEGLKNGLAFGFALSMASTVVLVRTLSDSDHLHTPVGHLTVGWEVLKDLFTVVALVLIPLFYGDASASMSGGALQVLWALLKIAGLVVFTVFVGVRLIPWLLARVAATHSRELFTLTILAVALTIAVGSARIFGVSYALGALLAGLVVGRSDFSFRAASEALPMRDASVSQGAQQQDYAQHALKPTYQQPYAPKPVFPAANYDQRPARKPPQNNPPPQPIVPVAHIEYEEALAGREDYTNDYVKGETGELVPMYYMLSLQQQRPMGRPVIKCFRCGGPHRKVDCPNRMLLGQFIPLCGDVA